jgi:hypothetical protein
MISTFDTLLHPRSCTDYKLGGTAFFRAASKKTMSRWGTNLQNPSKSICKLYVPDEGYTFVQTDQAGAEALVVAYLCRHGNFRDLFLSGIKSHTYVALHAFKEQWKKLLPEVDVEGISLLPVPLVKLHPQWPELSKLIAESDNWESAKRYYYIAKMICHASNYGITAGALRLNVLIKSEGTIVLSQKQAQFFLDIYHGLFPEIREWHKEIDETALNEGVLYTCQGFPITITVPLREVKKKDLYAAIPQATVGLITHVAITGMYNFINSSGVDWHVLNNKHDSLLAQCPDSMEEIRACGKKSQELISEQPLTTPRGEVFYMKSEAQYGWNWSPADKELKKNPRGLRNIPN